MGLFDKIFSKKQDDQVSMPDNAENHAENIDGISLLDRHEKGLIDDKSFLCSFGKVKVFYSTPFGDHNDGSSRLFALPAPDNTAYLPVFTSVERIKKFYDEAGRLGFLIMEDSFTSFLETTKKINEGKTPVKFGAVIDPGYYGVTINANALDVAIDMTKQA
ncbi:MAG: SseB family protein [Spirochaetes bacterium]|nr:SseB family protein [Spirochaetota bacterium]